MTFKPSAKFFWDKPKKDSDKDETTSSISKPAEDIYNPTSWDSLGFLME